MARPETVEDLQEQDRWQLRAREVLRFAPYDLTDVAGAVAALGALLDLLRVHPRVTIDGGKVHIELSDKQQQAVLTGVQRSYDVGAKQHAEWVADGVFPQFDAAMQLYCRYEGIEKPQKPEAAA